MAILVVFPAGATVVTTSPLYQWDKGHTLEIRVDTDSSRVEVHFSYKGLREAISSACIVSHGVVRVSIPDVCFEQSDTITAWVYEMNDGGGKTTRTILIPIKSRVRPPREAMEV